MNPIPHFEHGGSGPPLHFLHANGYPPGCYEPILEFLRLHYRVFGMLLRPLWPGSRPEDIRDWKPFSEDLLKLLDREESGPVIGVGHSIGAVVTLRAALWKPERFRLLVLLDPVLFPPRRIRLWNLIRLLGMGRRWHPRILGALSRRREFDDLQAVFQGYRRREVFRYLDDTNLMAYIAGITRLRAGGGFELVYSPEWESEIYYTGIWNDMDLWRGLPSLRLPILIVRGAETDTFTEEAARLVKRKQPRVRIETLAGSTHLLPLERPKEVMQIVHSFVQESV